MNLRILHTLALVLLALGCSTPDARAYRDLETGTFITRDPAGFVDGPNVYTYVRQNPWTKFDPHGLQSEFRDESSPTNRKEYEREVNSFNNNVESWKKAANNYNEAKVNLDDYKGKSRGVDYQRNTLISRFRKAEKALESFGSDFQEGLHYQSARIQHYESNADAEGNVSAERSTFKMVDRYTMGRGYRTTPTIDPIDILTGAVAIKTPAIRGFKVAAKATTLELNTATSWGRAETLADHFARHGGDFAASSADEYASMASRFLQESQAAKLPTKIDSQGAIRVFDPQTGAFGSFNPNGTTRTFYKPNSPTYFDRQPGTPVP